MVYSVLAMYLLQSVKLFSLVIKNREVCLVQKLKMHVDM